MLLYSQLSITVDSVINHSIAEQVPENVSLPVIEPLTNNSTLPELDDQWKENSDRPMSAMSSMDEDNDDYDGLFLLPRYVNSSKYTQIFTIHSIPIEFIRSYLQNRNCLICRRILEFHSKIARHRGTVT